MIFLTTATTVTAVTTVLLFFFYFLITFGKKYLTHLTTNVMFSGQRFAILARFFSCTFFFYKLGNQVCLETNFGIV